MPGLKLRSATTTTNKGAAGARALWRAGGLKTEDFGKPIVAVANSYTQFVPGHVHLDEVGKLVSSAIWEAGGVAREFNTIAVDDGIAMGHDGMLYSLPSRDLIADAVEYMVNAHCADALVCISNCDKITPGMLMAALRLNIPTVMVSGGPMEAGRIESGNRLVRLDPTDAYLAEMNPSYMPGRAQEVEEAACPTCGSCSGMFTANSMNCLTEALGLSLPGNGSTLASHADRKLLFEQTGQSVVALALRHYLNGDESILPRSIATFDAFENAMMVDIAMGGSTNTILHLLAAAHEAQIDFTMADVDRLSKKIPHLCKVSPATHEFFMEDVHRAGGIFRILGELDRAGLTNNQVKMVHSDSLADALERWDIRRSDDARVKKFFCAAPGGKRTTQGFSQDSRWETLDRDPVEGCVRDMEHAYSREGGLAVLFGNIAENGCIVKTGAVPEEMRVFEGTARAFNSQDAANHAILEGSVQPGDVVVVRYEGPRGGPGMQEMLMPTMSLVARQLHTSCALITDGRFSGATSGLSVGHISPEAAAKGDIALIEDGDRIRIDIPEREIALLVDELTLEKRRAAMDALGHKGWAPGQRERRVSDALRVFAAFASSADKGGVRDLSRLDN